MTSIVGPRATFGVIVPSTNTVVESEYYDMRPAGVSYHAGRLHIDNEALDSDDVFEAFLEQLREVMPHTIATLMTCKPTYLIMGMSAETFWGGAEGTAQFESWIHELSGRDVTTGATACKEALDALGARRLGIITPYQPVGDGQVRRFFTEMGFDVVDVFGFKCPSATAIAEVTPGEIEEAFRSVDGPDVDALVQVGTNLAAVKAAAGLEQELGKPVIPINAATNWHALRRNGIDDKIPGFGSLFEEH